MKNGVLDILRLTKIYVSHSSNYDYQNELYQPLRESNLNSTHEITLPHGQSTELFNSKEVIPTCNLIIAEVSLSSTGVGIEIGWANAAGVPVICIYKKGLNHPVL